CRGLVIDYVLSFASIVACGYVVQHGPPGRRSRGEQAARRMRNCYPSRNPSRRRGMMHGEGGTEHVSKQSRKGELTGSICLFFSLDRKRDHHQPYFKITIGLLSLQYVPLATGYLSLIYVSDISLGFNLRGGKMRITTSSSGCNPHNPLDSRRLILAKSSYRTHIP
ncbi:hypothetical protein F5Y16DRAFT_417046, partial [Xylariaceae sp. FL0255]